MKSPWLPSVPPISLPISRSFKAQLLGCNGTVLLPDWDPTLPPSIPAGPRRGWLQGNSLVGTAHFSGWHRIEGPDRQVQPVTQPLAGRRPLRYAQLLQPKIMLTCAGDHRTLTLVSFCFTRINNTSLGASQNFPPNVSRFYLSCLKVWTEYPGR